MSEIDRLYSYASLLSSRRALPRDEILHRLEISKATFKRDLTKLRDRLNMPVVFDKEMGGYRFERDDAYIATLEKEVIKFLTELDDKLNKVKSRG